MLFFIGKPMGHPLNRMFHRLAIANTIINSPGLATYFIRLDCFPNVILAEDTLSSRMIVTMIHLCARPLRRYHRHPLPIHRGLVQCAVGVCTQRPNDNIDNNLNHQHYSQESALSHCNYHSLTSILDSSTINPSSARHYFSTQQNNATEGSQNCNKPNNNDNDDNDDDDDEPEYLELVMHTADKMRSAVRAYISEYCSPHNTNVDTENSNSLATDVMISQCQRPPIKLVGILATNKPQPISNENCPRQSYEDDTYGNERYSEQIAASCANDGIIYEPWRVPPTIEAIERAIHHANERLDVHGILVFYPVFDKLLTTTTTNTNLSANNKQQGKHYKCQATGVYYRSMDDYFRDLVACDKDVEGYCRRGLRIQHPPKTIDLGLVSEEYGRTHDVDHIVKAEELGPIYPCTALAVYKIIESFHLSNESNTKNNVATATERSDKLFENTAMTIINRSEVLGLPLATMLSNEGATVYSINIDSILQFSPNGKVKREHPSTTLEQCVQNSSVIVSGVPSNTFKIPTDWIPNNSTVINVATEESNFDEDTICDERLGVTYVPHVGRVTVAALQYNLMMLHKNYHSK